jgi:hypothetical protein
MSTYFLIVFLILFGVTGLVGTSIPHWVVDISDLAAALSLLITANPWRKP